ncbi:hypothetical protein OSTOST_00825 [Ostertagia ostertagi]
MERLHTALDTLLEEICQGLNRPKCLRKAARESGLNLPKSDVDEITEKVVSMFRIKCEESVAELILDAEIDHKLVNLRFLTESCKEKNEELNIVDGYRPVSPKKDMEGPIHSVLRRYHESLFSANAGLQEDVEVSGELLCSHCEC